MPKSKNQKMKLLHLVKIFTEDTDEQHGLTVKDILQKLELSDIQADRRTLYQDFEELRLFGYDILSDRKGHEVYYYLASRTFELPELKLLVDSVQASRFITERKSRELIHKLETLVSRHEATHLNRQVILSGRIKTANEKIYYNVDEIHRAISENCKIRFQYYQWNVNKEMELRHGGKFYCVSPWALIWDDEKYYLVAYDSEEQKIKHYRVDKMLKISLCEGDLREGRDSFDKNQLAGYSTKHFNMYGGDLQYVTIEAENHFAGVFIDRFGTDIILSKTDDSHFTFSTKVEVSGQFLGWIVGLGPGVRITGPENVVNRMRSEAQRLSELYPEV
ncbi:MAG: WYL domain-containing protein [Firmicutes bacterium]|nr:WYL domain-containing protein [Bacillota bacterium]